MYKMSSLETPYDLEESEMPSKFTMRIRKPQEGKTFICTHDISSDTTHTLHLILTMNTKSAAKQFTSRLSEAIGPERIVEYNSTPSGSNPSKTLDDVLSHLELKPIKAIVCCAHTLKIRKNIPRLLHYLSDPRKKYKMVIHIDEAHKYILENREDIRGYNHCTIVTRIIGYSASPVGIWSTDRNDPLFHKIHIQDIEMDFGITRSIHYFGVKDCVPIYTDPIQSVDFPLDIPVDIIHQSGGNPRRSLYGEDYPFTIGNEQDLLSHIQYILPKLNIQPNQFSYHFIPSYTRKVTHYYSCKLILKQYPTANVIVMNGNGIQLFRQSGQILFKEDSKIEKILEPSKKIEHMIREFSGFPTFITGDQCLGMSVTLINESLGNFDTVVLNHTQYNPDILYQLCRFLFNYASWETKTNVKKTKIYTKTKEVLDTCLRYEELIDHIIEEHSGEAITLREINGTEPDEPSQREIKKGELNGANPTLRWKRYKVYDKNDLFQWNEVQKEYEKIRGKPLAERSRPTLSTQKKEQDDSDVYYHCSTTAKVKKHSIEEIERLKDQSWWSTLQLVEDQFTYARIFVGYDCLDDPTQYTIYLKYVILEENEYNKNILKKYGK